MNFTPHSCNCSCCTFNRNVRAADLTRREFILRVGTFATGSSFVLPALAAEAAAGAEPLAQRGPQPSKPFRVQPVLTYDTPTRRDKTSWRNWGGIQSDADAEAEKTRIEAELAKLKAKADFPLELRPIVLAKNVQQVEALAPSSYDAVLIYAAGGGGNILEKLVRPERWNLMFLRHEPGPAYLWYEIVHPRFLRKTVDDYGQPGIDVNDIVVDEHDELLWRMRALHGLNCTLGKRIVAIGGAGGWGAGGQQAPKISKDLWKLDIVDFPYKELEPLIQVARKNTKLLQSCEAAAHRYLGQPKLSLHTDRKFVSNAFVLREVMKDLMQQAGTDAITIQHCMGTIMGMSETTACLPLSMLNDEGFLAFCESDFVVIPSGILLHYISGKPVFLNDPTYPHDGVVTLAHCTAPRKMDGKKAEKTKILTHFESDYGAAPKVEMKLGQVCTNLVPDFASRKWVGFEATIVGNPFLDICRSQIDVKVKGNSQALMEEMKGFHWMMSYGDYLRETGYALKKIGIDFHNVSVAQA